MTLRGAAVVLVILAGHGLACATPAPAAASCIQTYDRTGAVVGRYCAEGLVEPGDTPAGDGAAAAPRTASRPPSEIGQRAAPRGSEIRCGGRNGRCRGVFTLR